MTVINTAVKFGTMMSRVLLMIFSLGFLFASCGGSSSTAPIPVLFFANFESDLSGWVGKSGGSHHGVIVGDPLNAGNNVLAFSGFGEAGDIFSAEITVQPGDIYTMTFDYLGLPQSASVPNDLGGTIGFSESTPGGHRWLEGTVLCCYIENASLIDDGQWRTYEVAVNPYEGWGVYSPPPANGTIRIMLEDFIKSRGVAGDAYFDNIILILGD